MTNKEAIEILEEEWRINEFFGKQFDEALELAIKAIDLLRRLEGFKYITTDVVLKEEQKLKHLDVYKTGWNDAIEAIKKASDRPLLEIINEIKETEVMDNYNKAD